MTLGAEIYVAGHRGMVGSAIVRALHQQGPSNIVTRTHADLDLTNQAAVQAFFRAEKPTQVYLAAAKVGGIHANKTDPQSMPPAIPVVRIDPHYFRPTEVETLLGDPTKTKEKLGWVPEITLDELVQEMMSTNLADAKKHALLKVHGYNVNVSVE